jgi:hypothetical protein
MDIADQQGMKGFIFGVVATLLSIISFYIILFAKFETWTPESGSIGPLIFVVSLSGGLAFLFAGLNLSIHSLETLDIETSEEYVAREGGEVSPYRYMGFYLNLILLAAWTGFWIYFEILYMSAFILLVIILKAYIVGVCLLQRKFNISFGDGDIFSFVGIVLGTYSAALMIYAFVYTPTITVPELLATRLIIAIVFSIICCIAGGLAALRSTDYEGHSKLSYYSGALNGILILIWIIIGTIML